jgi:hypothetical protein
MCPETDEGSKTEMEKKGNMVGRLEFVIHKKTIDIVLNITYSYSLPIGTR